MTTEVFARGAIRPQLDLKSNEPIGGLQLYGVGIDGLGFAGVKNGGWMRGLDVSHHQKNIETGYSLEGMQFGIVRATYGVKPDALFAGHANRIKREGRLLGAYHFFRQGQDRAAQLDAFLRTVDGFNIDIAPAPDFEWNTKYDGKADREIINRDGSWLTEQLAKRFGQVMPYTAPFFWWDVLGAPSWMVEHCMWLAHYTKPGWPKLPPSPPPHLKYWAIHQYQGAPIDTNVAEFLPLCSTW